MKLPFLRLFVSQLLLSQMLKDKYAVSPSPRTSIHALVSSSVLLPTAKLCLSAELMFTWIKTLDGTWLTSLP